MSNNEIIAGNYKATVNQITDGYGDTAFRCRVLCMTGTHSEGDVLLLKNYDTERAAFAAARRELKKAA
jgi:hypothetical protein